MGKFDWDDIITNKVEGVEDAVLKSITEMADLTATIPTIWNPQLERYYRRLVKMEQFAVVNTDLYNKPGDKVKISRMAQLGAAEDLEKTGPAGETARGAEVRWNNTTNGIEVAFTTFELVEFQPTYKFKAVKFSKKALQMSFAGRMSDATEGLAYAFALKDDMDAFEALTASTNIIWGDGSTSAGTSWATLATTNIHDLLNTDAAAAARVVYDNNTEMNEFAYFPGNTLVCLIHPLQKYSLVRDVNWFDVVKRNSADAIFKNELVEWQGIRFVQSTGVPFFAAGTLTAVTPAQNMARADATLTGAKTTWYFSTDGTYANRKGYIAPRYQTAGAGTEIDITLHATDDGAKVTYINYVTGTVKFDVPVGGTAAPTATFTYGQYAGFCSPLIGPRAFAKAKKSDPVLKQELTNYGMFIGIGGDAAWDTQLLNPEQCILINNVALRLPGMMPAYTPLT